MLMHITPRIVTPLFLLPTLVELEIPELGLTLLDGKDLATGKPYPNKRYSVGRRKGGRKAVSGLLLETPSFLSEYTVIFKWKCIPSDAAKDSIFTHKVRYIVLDTEFDAVSDEMLLWLWADAPWESRWPDCAKGLIPAKASPRMDIFPTERQGEIEDTIWRCEIIERSEVFRIPTIERERFTKKGVFSLPTPESRLVV